MILVFLQNAYGVEEGYVPSYRKKSFRLCHTSKRLAEMLPLGERIEIRNCNPEIGDTASSFFKADRIYMLRELSLLQPDIVLACGTEAKEAFGILKKKGLKFKNIVYAPHPAWRQLSKTKTKEIQEELYAILEQDFQKYTLYNQRRKRQY